MPDALLSAPLPPPLRARSARLARVLDVLLVVLAFLLLAERFGAVAVAIGRSGFEATTLAQVGRQLALAIPDGCYLMALAWVRIALAGFARGAFHTPVIAAALRRVGVMLAFGAAFALFAVPTLLRWFGSDPGYVIAYDIGSAVLCALGASLALVAQVLERAAAVQAELDGIF